MGTDRKRQNVPGYCTRPLLEVKKLLRGYRPGSDALLPDLENAISTTGVWLTLEVTGDTQKKAHNFFPVE